MAIGTPGQSASDIVNVIVGIAASRPELQVRKYDGGQSQAREMGRYAGGMGWDNQRTAT